mgnify:CR=1 FL=1
MDSWERFNLGADQFLESLGFVQTLEVYPASASYTPGDGWSVTYPDTPDATLDAEIVPPTATATRERGGLDTDADVVIFIEDEPGFSEGTFGGGSFSAVAYTEYGEDGEAPARLRDVTTDTYYELESYEAEHNGLLRLEAMEVDQ